MTRYTKVIIFSSLYIFVFVAMANADTFDITTFSFSPLRENGTYAYGINDTGQIVGTIGGQGNGYPSGFVLNGGVFTDLNHPLGIYGTSLNNINNTGQIVGSYQSGITGNTENAFLYSDGIFTDLDLPPSALYASANGINDSGQIVGDYATTANTHYGFLYSNGIYTTIAHPLASVIHGSITVARGINNLGQVVGTYFSDTGNKGFVYSDGVYTDIDIPIATTIHGLGINDAGQIVGWYDYTNINGSSSSNSFVYSNGAYTNLDVYNSIAWDINNRGEIVGYYGNGWGPNGGGFLATPVSDCNPVPEPTSLLLLSTGIGGLGLVAYRRKRK